MAVPRMSTSTHAPGVGNVGSPEERSGALRGPGERRERQRGPHLPPRARARTDTHAHGYSCPGGRPSNFSQRLSAEGRGRCGGGPGGFGPGCLGSRPPRAPQHTWLLPNPIPAPCSSLAPFPNLQNCLLPPPQPPLGGWGPREALLEKRKVAEGGARGEGQPACSAITLAAAPAAGRGWHGVRPPPRTPPPLASPPLPQVRAKPHHHPQRARGWEAEESEVDEPRETRNRGAAVAGPGLGEEGSWCLVPIPGPQSKPGAPSRSAPSFSPADSLGEDRPGSARSAPISLC